MVFATLCCAAVGFVMEALTVFLYDMLLDMYTRLCTGLEWDYKVLKSKTEADELSKPLDALTKLPRP